MSLQQLSQLSYYNLNTSVFHDPLPPAIKLCQSKLQKTNILIIMRPPADQKILKQFA